MFNVYVGHAGEPLSVVRSAAGLAIDLGAVVGRGGRVVVGTARTEEQGEGCQQCKELPHGGAPYARSGKYQRIRPIDR